MSFFLNPATLFTFHQGQSNGSGLSPRLWTNAYNQRMSPNGTLNAKFFADDFQNFPAANTGISGATAGYSGGYAWYIDTATSACSITQRADADDVIRIATGATDNHEAWLTSGGNTGNLGSINATAGSEKMVIFETRFRVGQIATGNYFIGLSEEGLAAANTVSDAGAVADKDFIGFLALEAASSTLSFYYKKAGQTAVTVATAATLAAETWYKLGFIYDPSREVSKRLAFYVDNVEQSTYVTQTQMQAATFPSAERMSFLAGVKNSSAAANWAEIDWWAYYRQV